MPAHNVYLTRARGRTVIETHDSLSYWPDYVVICVPRAWDRGNPRSHKIPVGNKG